MGFLEKNEKTEVFAKLTPIGKRKIMNNGINFLASKFVLGDSDANYYSAQPIVNGLIADSSYDVDSIFHNYDIKHKVMLSENERFKNIGSENISVTENMTTEEFIHYGYQSELVYIDKSRFDENLNLLSTIGMPMTEQQEGLYTHGIFSRTAYHGLNRRNYLVLPVDGFEGDIIDGLNIKITIRFSGKEVTLYSAYSEGVEHKDKSMFDDYSLTTKINLNSVMLFSDDIAKPINGNDKSWSTGYGLEKPYANGKESFNIFSQKGESFGDTIVGYFLLDKGLIVIADDYIINNREDIVEYQVDAKMNYTNQKYEMTCLVNRNDFTISTNPTYQTGDVIRVSEIGLYDDYQKLIAVGKFNNHLELDRTSPVVISIIINF